MTLLLIAGSALCGWLVLSVLSGERQRRMSEPQPPGRTERNKTS